MSLVVFYLLLGLSSQLELINQLHLSTEVMPLGTNDSYLGSFVMLARVHNKLDCGGQ